ncbi:hypothetical protein GCM10025864_22960 [Luteimicrobium album]|uniref:Uncharacterized protein n=1 Tax=Luteimicrobium album TaxID=1054550 RepID=A0ABQ6I1P0_9MICO|nr:hypothetical protein GCM10025864_22960 [Luteimicrobium album]
MDVHVRARGERREARGAVGGAEVEEHDPLARGLDAPDDDVDQLGRAHAVKNALRPTSRSARR